MPLASTYGMQNDIVILSGFAVGVNFEWQSAKAESNLRKHGVTFAEALTVFADPLARIFDDPDHSAEESREFIVGNSGRQRLLIVNFTERGRRTRIISARAAARRERHDYEQNTRNS